MTRKIKFNLNQLSLPFGESRNTTISYDSRARFFWAMVTCSLMSLVFYFYAINATARNIALRASLESTLMETQASLSHLEFSYIELKNGVDLETAHAYGYTEVKDPLYVSRNKVDTLTLNTVNR